jgi:hypothetical protein
MYTEIILNHLVMLMLKNKVNTKKGLLNLIDDKEIIYIMFEHWGALKTLYEEITNKN